MDYQEKATETICSCNLMVECNMNMHVSYIPIVCYSMHAYRSLAPLWVTLSDTTIPVHHTKEFVPPKQKTS